MDITQQHVDQFIAELPGRAHVVGLPLRTRFRGIDAREAMLIRTPGGWVEFAPFLEYGPEEASQWLRSAIVHSVLLDATPSGSENLAVPDGVGVEINATMPAVDAAANPEMIGELMGRYPGVRTVKVKVAEPSVLREQGFEAAADQDVARVRAVRSWFADHGVEAPKIRVDANGGWSVDQAISVVERLVAEDVAGGSAAGGDTVDGGAAGDGAADGLLDYVEQPCGSIAELAELRERLRGEGISCGGEPVRIAADELIRKAADPLRVVAAGACDVAVVKVAPLGGVDKVLEVAQRVAHYGVSLTVSSALDTAVGIGAGLHAAALVGQVRRSASAPVEAGDFGVSGVLGASGAADGSNACDVPGGSNGSSVPSSVNAAGLGTGSLFSADVGYRRISHGGLQTGAIDADPEVLQRYAVPAERRHWWLARAVAAAQKLTPPTPPLPPTPSR